MSDRQDTYFYRGLSMGGTFRPGDDLLISHPPIKDVRPGDIVVFEGSDGQGNVETIVHRVIAAVPAGLKTRGDTQFRTDPGYVTETNLKGKVTHLRRDGTLRPVRGGLIGLWLARLFFARNVAKYGAWRVLCRVGRRPYRWLRRSGLIPRLWKPTITTITMTTEHGPLVKYICGRRTVAEWWPEQNYFQCRKPYDLLIPDHRGEN